jgi:23S rRNA (cytidine1920-2'-O)/16S rRNA (cytidine1409-2'-O)-methyltransferase
LSKTRLDQLLVGRGLAASRARARAMIAEGAVLVAGAVAIKPGGLVADDAELVVAGAGNPWVSRAAFKLVHGLDHFAIDPAGLVALDIGASTGGFSEVLLARGATRVYAVDVGTGQLAERLRAEPRLISLEKTNARTLSAAQVPEAVGIIVCDASFIGLTTVLPAALALARPGAFLVALIKPQFEVGPGKVGGGGIVRDPALHEAVCSRIGAWLAAQPGWQPRGICESPIRGGDGNREFILAGRYLP